MLHVLHQQAPFADCGVQVRALTDIQDAVDAFQAYKELERQLADAKEMLKESEGKDRLPLKFARLCPDWSGCGKCWKEGSEGAPCFALLAEDLPTERLGGCVFIAWPSSVAGADQSAATCICTYASLMFPVLHLAGRHGDV